MAQIELSPDEVRVLTDVLEHHLSELRMEIADTDRKDFRDGLKEKKEILIRIKEKLSPRT